MVWEINILFVFTNSITNRLIIRKFLVYEKMYVLQSADTEVILEIL